MIRTTILIFFISATLTAPTTLAQRRLGSQFTYQGKLKLAGLAFDGANIWVSNFNSRNVTRISLVK